MLTVKLNNGVGEESVGTTERIYYINDVEDLKTLALNVLDEFKSCLEQEKSEERILLERLVDKAGVSDIDELEDWIEEAYEIRDALDSSDYDSIDEMTERLDELNNAVDEAYETLRYVRG